MPVLYISGSSVLGDNRLHPILDTQIAAIVNRVGAAPRSVQVGELGYRWGIRWLDQY